MGISLFLAFCSAFFSKTCIFRHIKSGHIPRSGPEVKNGRSGTVDGAPEKLICVTVKEEVSQILQRVSAGAA